MGVEMALIGIDPASTVRGVSPTSLTFILLAAALSPLLWIETPAMVDYVNHLARMHLLASDSPHSGYDVVWQFNPNLAMDLIVPFLARWMPVDVAARLFLAAAQILIVSGAVALERSVKGQHSFAGLCALSVLFSLPFAWGLTNFTFAIGLCLWGLAIWIGMRERPLLVRWAVHACVVLALFVSHFFALGLYGLIVGLMELPHIVSGRISWKEAGKLTVLLASPVAVLLAMMAMTGGTIGGAGQDWDFGLKLLWFPRFMNAYDATLSLVTGVVAIGLIFWLVAYRRLRLSEEGVWIALGLALLYLVLPRRLFDVAFLDIRVLAAAALVLPAFTLLKPSRIAAAILVGLAVVNGTSTLVAWSDRQSDYAEFRASFALLEPGTAVLSALHEDSGMADQSLYYAPTLAASEAGVFVASLYSAGGMQPISASAPFQDLKVEQSLDYLPVPLADLLGDAPPRHAANWMKRYRYVYVIGTPRESPLAGVLVEIARGERFTLYRVTPKDKPA